MKKEKRYEIILEYLKKSGTLSVKEIVEKLHVSATTVRNDLNVLADWELILRTHGGAVLPPSVSKDLLSIPNPHVLEIANQNLKENIGKEAAKLVSDNDTIFIGCGSTFYVFSHYLKNFKNLKIVTTNLNVVYELASTSHSVYFIGGELMELNGIYYTGGPKIPYELEKVFVNKAFIGVSGIDLKAGLTIYDLTQLNLYSSICKIARDIILVCDKSKFGCQSAHLLGPIKGFANTIVTNKEIDATYQQAIENMGIRFITA
ncbi:MAG: DeoR/GlpR family DNA-binding transcription regulator [Lachnospiraceae bacterium]